MSIQSLTATGNVQCEGLLLEQLVAQDEEGRSKTAAEEHDEQSRQTVPVCDLEWQVLEQKTRHVVECSQDIM